MLRDPSATWNWRTISTAGVVVVVGLGAGLAIAHLGYKAVAIGVGVAAIALPLSPTGVAVTTGFLVLAPDSPAFMHLRGLEVTPRVGALAVVLIQCGVAICAGKAKPRLSYPRVWTVYAGSVGIGAVLADRPQAFPLFLLFVLLPFTAGCTIGANQELVRGAVRGIVVGVCVLSAVAIVEFLRNKPFFAPVYSVGTGDYTRSGNLRANAGWVHPLALGMFLCLGAFLTIDEIRRKGGGGVGIAGALLVAGGLFAVQERSPLLGVSVGAIAYIVAQLDGRRRRQATALAAILLVATVAVPGSRGAAFRTFLDQSTSAQTTASVNITGRLELVSLGIGAVRSQPVFGFGYGASENVMGDAALRPLLTQGFTTFTDIADWPLSIAVDTGLIGLAAFIVIVCRTLRRMVRERAVTDPAPVAALLAGIVAALVCSLGVAETTSAMIFLFVLGVCSTNCGPDRCRRECAGGEGDG